ncbi:MAG: glutamate racemase [Eubacteriales bacterium]|nr:glutamate racemase [Eubacteriales bacterium]
MIDLQAPIAVFDSGMGGISVLRELVRCMPQENFLFFGDSLHAPYGVRPLDEVRALTMQAAEHFLKCGVKAIVIACNTATSAAITDLRQRFPELPVIGLEPALKPAVLACPNGRVLVMATPLTLREHKFAALLEHYQSQAEILSLPAPRLVEFVEQDGLHSPALTAYLSALLAPFRENPVDGVVLGCTHFPFAQEQIAQALGYPVKFFDGGAGAARETRRLLLRAGTLIERAEPGQVVFTNSEPTPERLALCQRLFHL